MPFVLLSLGTVLVITGLKGDAAQLYNLIAGDFTGQNNFVYWALSILVIGFLGYIKQLQGLSRLFLVLVLVVLLLHNKGFFAQLQSFISGKQSNASSSAVPSSSLGGGGF